MDSTARGRHKNTCSLQYATINQLDLLQISDNMQQLNMAVAFVYFWPSFSKVPNCHNDDLIARRATASYNTIAIRTNQFLRVTDK